MQLPWMTKNNILYYYIPDALLQVPCSQFGQGAQSNPHLPLLHSEQFSPENCSKHAHLELGNKLSIN